MLIIFLLIRHTVNIKKDNIFTLLTKRELEVLKYILLGKTAKQIAKEINLSHRTIEEYTGKIKRKLQCHHKSEIYSKIVQYK